MRVSKPALSQEAEMEKAQSLVDGAHIGVHDDAKNRGDDDRGHGDGHEEDGLEHAGSA